MKNQKNERDHESTQNSGIRSFAHCDTLIELVAGLCLVD